MGERSCAMGLGIHWSWHLMRIATTWVWLSGCLPKGWRGAWWKRRMRCVMQPVLTCWVLNEVSPRNRCKDERNFRLYTGDEDEVEKGGYTIQWQSLYFNMETHAAAVLTPNGLCWWLFEARHSDLSVRTVDGLSWRRWRGDVFQFSGGRAESSSMKWVGLWCGGGGQVQSHNWWLMNIM